MYDDTSNCASRGTRSSRHGVAGVGSNLTMRISRPNRVTHTYTQHLAAEPARVFPLLCPVLEAEWVEGWDPLLVISNSGVAESDCVFVTAAAPRNAVWIISRHEPQHWFVEMFKVTPEVTVCRLSIQLSATSAGTDARVTYSHTSLGPRGDEFIASFTEEFYRQFMRDWELQLNHYLRTGERSSSA